MKTLIIGAGEIGKSLKRVLEPVHEVYIRDKPDLDVEGIEVLHICFPYSEYFLDYAKHFIKQYKPTYTVIHSTVPVGTTKKLKAYHSPVRGVHPNLTKALKTFVKYLAPKNENLAKYFRKAGISISLVEKSETTELGKILSTTKYGMDIVFNKEAYELAKLHGADFKIAYEDFTKTYNEGYKALGKGQYVRPILKFVEGKIGGHCVLQNCKLLVTVVTNFIQSRNKNY